MGRIDKTSLDQFVEGDDELLAELASAFVKYLPDMEARLRFAVGDSDPSALQEAAHQIKSRLGYFFAASLQEAAYQLETCGRQCEMQNSADLLNDLLQGIHEMLDELRQFTKLQLQVEAD